VSGALQLPQVDVAASTTGMDQARSTLQIGTHPPSPSKRPAGQGPNYDRAIAVRRVINSIYVRQKSNGLGDWYDIHATT
jgi:hypothetical protein